MRWDPISLNALLARKAEVDATLAHLQTFSNDDFCSELEISWGDFGDLAQYANVLEDLVDKAYQSSE